MVTGLGQLVSDPSQGTSKADPAFPPRPGLRDYFAGQALAGLCANPYFVDEQKRVETAWLYADLMLHARP
jgi:hypothetical protein